MLAKTQPHLLFQHPGLGDHRGDHRDQCGHAGRVHPGQLDPHRELLAAQRRHDLGSPGLEVALPPGLTQQGRNPGWGEPPTGRRVGCRSKDGEGVTAGEVVAERFERGRVALPQQRAQRVRRALPHPDHRLVRPRRQPDLLGQHTVTSRWTVVGPVKPDDLSEDVRIAGVGLRPRHPVAFPVPRRLQRVDRVDGVTGGDQRLHPRTPIGLDPHDHLVGVGVQIGMLAQQLVEACHPGQPFR